MGFFSSLKKVFNPGGAVVSKVINDGHDYQGIVDYGMNGAKNAKSNQDAEKAAQKDQYSPKPVFSPDPGLNPQARNLGWTNGGYQYHNSPFNKSPSMSFGGGQVPPSQSPMGMGAPQPQMGLQSPQQGGMVPGAGAPPQGQPTMQTPPNPQMVQAMMLRNGQRMM